MSGHGREGLDDESVLATFGWMPWPDAVHMLGQAAALWLGPAGVTRVSALAVEHASRGADPPVTTRIHAWEHDGRVMWRLVPRQANGSVLVTGLAPAVHVFGHDPVAAQSVSTETVTHGGWQRTWIVAPSPIMFLRPVVIEGEGAS